jgi:hypothetical protein
MQCKRLFISHSSQDKPFVNRIVRRLQEHGVDNAWYDVREIDATADIQSAMSKGVHDADLFALVLTPQAATSQWVSFEIQQALAAGKPVVALVDAPSGQVDALLQNPFVGQLLLGGRHKLLRFRDDFDAAFLELLKAIAPDIGQRAIVEARTRTIFEGEDPDEAERVMSFAALEAEQYIPYLLKRLADLRNDRKLCFRAQRFCCHIGDDLVVPLLQVLTRQEPETFWRMPPPPPGNVIAELATADGVITGRTALDWMRWIRLNDVAPGWSAQLGAEYCITAMGQQNARLKARTIEELNSWLRNETSFISQQRRSHEFSEDYYDALRLSIETAGLLAPDAALNPFLIREFLSDELWGEHASYAKEKLASYVISFLSRCATEKSLRYLITVLSDPSPGIARYTTGNVIPNPTEDCFVPFGHQAVEPLLAILNDELLQRVALQNLAAIPNPAAVRAVMTKLLSGELGLPLSRNLVRRLAANGLPESSQAVIEAYRSGHPVLCPPQTHQRDDVDISIAIAARNCGDKEMAEEICGLLLEHNHPGVLSESAQAVGELHLFAHYRRLQSIFTESQAPSARGHAAIALARHGAVDRDDLVRRLGYAEPQVEKTLLSVALSYFNDPTAIPGLVEGLKLTFLHGIDEFHDVFGQALARMTIDEAQLARAKWFRRL